MSSKTLIALALNVENTRKALDTMEEHAGTVDLAELRVDLMKECDLHVIMANKPMPIIVTNRPAREGGAYEGDESARIGFLIKAVEFGAEYVDCEADAVQLFRRLTLRNTRLIVSKHDFQKMPDLHKLHQELSQLDSDVVKLVGMARSPQDAAAPLKLLHVSTVPTIALAMGSKGVASRILASRYGGYLTFVSAGVQGQQTAPGQITAAMMQNDYFVNDMNSDTTICAYFCTSVSAQQLEIASANRQIRSAGKNAVVVPFEIDREVKNGDIDALQQLGICTFAFAPDTVTAVSRLWPSVSAKSGEGVFLNFSQGQPRPYCIEPFMLSAAVKVWLAEFL